MQRKANLGMNAVLPVSIVLMRVLAAREGLEPEEYMRNVLEAGIDRRSLYDPDAIVAGPGNLPLRSEPASAILPDPQPPVSRGATAIAAPPHVRGATTRS